MNVRNEADRGFSCRPPASQFLDFPGERLTVNQNRLGQLREKSFRAERLMGQEGAGSALVFAEYI
jgi:hypothetical protein